MHNYKMTIQYDGAKYKGWQRLGSGEKTIQGKIEQVIGELVGKPVEIIGASRTDAGVHALGQVANVKLDEDIGETKLYNVLNHQLPPDICVLSVERVPETFHARFDAIEKTYLYKNLERTAQPSVYAPVQHACEEETEHRRHAQSRRPFSRGT